MRAISAAVLILAVILVCGCGKKGVGVADGGGGGGSSTATVPADLTGSYLVIGDMRDGKLRIESDFFDSPEHIRMRTRKFTADTMTTHIGNDPYTQPIKLDASKTPGHIDLITKGSKKGEADIVSKGIYQMDGGVLTMSFAGERPTKFNQKTGMTYKMRKLSD